MSRVITKRAPAKINLYLHVTGKRNDGYHLLDSLVVFANDIADIVTIAEAPTFSFIMSGPLTNTLGAEAPNKNLAVRAAKLFHDVTGKPLTFTLHLEKNIPIGAGLGGGSSDAAATIKALEEFYNIEIPDRDDHLLKLGADVPVCYRAKPSRFEGIGEIVSDAPTLPCLPMLLIWPSRHSATKEVFEKRSGGFSARASLPHVFDDLLGFLQQTTNDLADAAKILTPEITTAETFIRNQKGCRLARMSGSGSAVFGIFDTLQNAEAAAKNCPQWWAKTTLTGNE